ncbi:hypothetical protein [Actinophytocola sp.]|uniref:hypothetical protein n=1 Tax=Actinophytocola sp. TaxID=1872138 RepID=UPI002ED2C097
MSTGSSRQLWLLPVLLITVIATALGALVARSLYKEPPPSPPAAVEPSPSVVPLSEQPGSAEVQGTVDATTHPLFNTLQSLLQRYFDAINEKDYDGWSTTVTNERLRTTPEKQWRIDYRSTRDGSIVIYRIEATGDDTARVLLRFTSIQHEDDAPPELRAPCINWNVVWLLAKDRNEWKLAGGPTSKNPQTERCPGT